MKLSEIKDALVNFAKEDLEILKDNGCSAVTDTEIGVIHLEIDGELIVGSVKGDKVIETTDEQEFIDFMVDNYTVEF